jgi:hypothetical protein
MDRENLLVPGWSHVLSSSNDIGELEAFRLRLGVPPGALHIRDNRPHLDLTLWARDLALQDPAVRVFETTRELLRAWREHRTTDDRRRATGAAGRSPSLPGREPPR